VSTNEQIHIAIQFTLMCKTADEALDTISCFRAVNELMVSCELDSRSSLNIFHNLPLLLQSLHYTSLYNLVLVDGRWASM